MDIELTYSERWFLAYDITFNDWCDNNEKNGILHIPSCALDDIWTEIGIPKYESEIDSYIKLKLSKESPPNIGVILKKK